MRWSERAVPEVATSSKPSDWSSAPSMVDAGLSRSHTDRNTTPDSGSGLPAARSAFENAVGKSGPIPITSPVERISGPSVGSAPENRWNGNTAAFTLTWFPAHRLQRHLEPQRSPAGGVHHALAGGLGDERHRP